MKYAVITLCVFIAAFRVALLFYDFNEHVDKSYQAIAHGLVFSMFAVALVLRYMAYRLDWLVPEAVDWCWENWGWLFRWAFVLTVVELVCFGIKFSGVLA